ncbi:hypothetical protein Dsin_005887 [Dipteronia sinensis]|uniref:Calmodulin-binding domain-containing protein n=1 Tax=Dipteronia sinensis TaxID=43782 RepID=A0AAE0AY66_9ROSI|nr:hypothetical protein Dsin_005887 [Dipteronia sinensis]
MTKEKTEYLYIPETVQLKDGHKRSSTGKIGYLDGGANIGSRYLRPSTGSCHDFCKYGVEHALEIKARCPVPMSKRIKRIMATQGEGTELEKTVTSAEKVKKLAVNNKPPLGSNTKKRDDPVDKEQVSSLIKKETTSSKHVSLPPDKIDLLLKCSNDTIRTELSSLADEETIYSKSPLKETDILVTEVSSNQYLTPMKEINVFVEHSIDPINKDVSSSAYEEIISSSQVLMSIKEEDVFMKHASDPFNKEVLSLGNKEAISSSEGLTSIKEVDVYMKHSNEPINREVLSVTPLKEVDVSVKDACDPIDKEVSSLAYKEAILLSQILIPTKEEDVLRKPDSDPFNKEVSSSANKEAISSIQGMASIKEVDIYMKHADEPSDREFLTLAKKEAISSKQVSKPLKEVDVYMIHDNEPIDRVVLSSAKKEAISPKQNVFRKRLGEPKLKKPMKSNLSSLGMQRSNNQGDRKMRKSKQVEDLPVNSPGISTVRRKSEIKTSKEMRSSKRVERKVLVPLAVSLSTKRSVKRPSIKSVEKSSNLNGVPHLSNQKTVKKTKHERFSSRDVPEKTLSPVELNSVRKSLRPVKNGICTTDSSSPPGNRNLKRANHGIRTAVLPSSPVKRNLRRTQPKVHTAQSPKSWSSSLKNEVLRSIQLQTHVTGSTLSLLVSSSAQSGESSEDSEMKTENGILHSSKENSSRSRNGGTISLKGKSDSVQKLTFRKGKVIELQQEDNTPRRLKFKQRLLGGNQNVEGDDASRDRVITSVEKKEDCSKEASVTKTESKKVVLRRRDVKGGTNSCSLCNNVIEETVSKLVKTRASKVKALVGAFESLISDLQVTADAS